MKLFFYTSLLLVSSLLSCKKTPGEGGNAQIKGKYWVKKYDAFFTNVTGEYPAINQTVYLYFGEDASPGTSVKTNENGEFSFTYLRKGSYRVVAYSQRAQGGNGTSLPKDSAVETIVNIGERKAIKDIGQYTLFQ